MISLLLLPFLFASEALNWEASFAREYSYLIAQRESLKTQLSRHAQKEPHEIKALQSQIESLQKELARASVANDRRQEELQDQERQNREDERRAQSLVLQFEKAQKSLALLQARLNLASQEMIAEKPQKVGVKDFAQLFSQATELLQTSQAIRPTEASFFDLKGEFHGGWVQRLGTLAAIGQSAGESFVLGPDGKGGLRAIDSVKASGNWTQLFLFSSMAKAAEIKFNKSWREWTADQAPLLFLSLILVLVGWLFVAILKV